MKIFIKFIRCAILPGAIVFYLGTFFYSGRGVAQTKPSSMKHVLVISETKGFEHDSVPDAMATIWNMGHDTGLWDTYIRTDTELITKGKVGPNVKNLTISTRLCLPAPPANSTWTISRRRT